MYRFTFWVKLIPPVPRAAVGWHDGVDRRVRQYLSGLFNRPHIINEELLSRLLVCVDIDTPDDTLLAAQRIQDVFGPEGVRDRGGRYVIERISISRVKSGGRLDPLVGHEPPTTLAIALGRRFEALYELSLLAGVTIRSNLSRPFGGRKGVSIG